VQINGWKLGTLREMKLREKGKKCGGLTRADGFFLRVQKVEVVVQTGECGGLTARSVLLYG
jgi:hypothetical protein